jgi:hypothetical protein
LNQTRIKFFDRILTSNPINNISNVWSGCNRSAIISNNQNVKVSN